MISRKMSKMNICLCQQYRVEDCAKIDCCILFFFFPGSGGHFFGRPCILHQGAKVAILILSVLHGVFVGVSMQASCLSKSLAQSTPRGRNSSYQHFVQMNCAMGPSRPFNSTPRNLPLGGVPRLLLWLTSSSSLHNYDPWIIT